ncbi:MAG TPA: aminotransferase class V-fold PLP-dependent enzyme [Vicinamibacterales bacterium]|nr:aminotransferase class V-fold PLP-dependent enzyme [Vicinamibacterales bacterium]HOQ60202.1 aminotransferase class V-fold PLP-dependent enzyme [Vicinamibacterales bacterium]HPK71486.1 aminotransferase class V-fold PLP-dependent enzyme [Vicinamibacterales bacterium]HPW20322.1 aminotransferase class V-fold PLP-dependent enzyme [Vicinamibacterales bacterium]
MDTRYADAFERFLSTFPGYAATSALDALRASDYARLDALGHVYLDYTGGGLFSSSQIRRHQDLLLGSVLGNPHSGNPTSRASSGLVDEARAAVLGFFNADPAEYGVIFAANASGALKLVGESFPFGPGGRYLLTYDNHNSVNGIREYARRLGARVTYVPVCSPELRCDPDVVRAELELAPAGTPCLFAYPAQSNFSGVQHPLEWVAWARERGWRVLLDCAAFAPTNRLDLAGVKPDFVPLSFYKMFGYPTGIGALIYRHEALRELRRPWFAGGTITVASVQGDGWHHLAPGHSGFEDGTVDYLSLPAVTIGLEHLASVGIDLIHERVMALTGWLVDRLAALAHTSGARLARVFGPTELARRGGTIAFYLLAPDGMPYDVRALEAAAGRSGISLRTGCFCNPGDGEVAHGITRDDMALCFVGSAPAVTFEDCTETIRFSTGKTPNTMRASFGLASNFADAYALVAFAERFKDVPADPVTGAPALL